MKIKEVFLVVITAGEVLLASCVEARDTAVLSKVCERLRNFHFDYCQSTVICLPVSSLILIKFSRVSGAHGVKSKLLAIGYKTT